LILLDLNMPRPGGPEVLAEIRQTPTLAGRRSLFSLLRSRRKKRSSP